MQDGTTHAVLEDLLVRFERLEMVCGLLSGLAAKHTMPANIAEVLQQFSQSVTAERRQREHGDTP